MTDIVKEESIRFFVQEQKNSFAIESLQVLKDEEVLFHLKELVSKYKPLNNCTVPEDSCPKFNSIALERLVLLKSIATDLFQFVDDLLDQVSIEDWVVF